MSKSTHENLAITLYNKQLLHFKALVIYKAILIFSVGIMAKFLIHSTSLNLNYTLLLSIILKKSSVLVIGSCK